VNGACATSSFQDSKSTGRAIVVLVAAEVEAHDGNDDDGDDDDTDNDADDKVEEE